MTRFALIAALASALALPACGPAILPGPQPITGTSEKVNVKGEYRAVSLDSVERFTISNGKLLIYGQTGSEVVDLPAGAEQPKVGEQWALVTEANENGKRTLTFTQEQTLEDFTIAVPPGTADVHYGTLAGKDGLDVLVFAWGEHSKSYWGYVTISRK